MVVEAAVVVVVATTTPNKQQNQKWNDIIVITTLLSLFVDELMWYENQTYEHYGSENRMYMYICIVLLRDKLQKKVAMIRFIIMKPFLLGMNFVVPYVEPI